MFHVATRWSSSLPAILLLLIGSASVDPLCAAESLPSQKPQPAPCTASPYRAFDFWIGDWQVYGGSDKLLGTNRIEPVLGGCAIEEHWRNDAGTVEGRSFSLYDGPRKEWVQYWVDNSGGTLVLAGQYVDGAMDLSGERPHPTTGKPQRQRVRWTPASDGSVRQLWETSDDEGASWQVVFDGVYRRR